MAETKACFECGKEVPSVHGDTNYQFSNAMWLAGFGGFGMFVESGVFTGEKYDTDNPITSQTNAAFAVMLCEDCSNKVFDVLPALKTKMLD